MLTLFRRTISIIPPPTPRWSEDHAVAVGMNWRQAHFITLVLENVRRCPDQWTFTDYRAKNRKLNIDVNTSNRFYATSVTGPGIEVGGNSNGSREPEKAEGWRKELVLALEAIAIARMDAEFEKASADSRAFSLSC